MILKISNYKLIRQMSGIKQRKTREMIPKVKKIESVQNNEIIIFNFHKKFFEIK